MRRGTSSGPSGGAGSGNGNNAGGCIGTARSRPFISTIAFFFTLLVIYNVIWGDKGLPMGSRPLGGSSSDISGADTLISGSGAEHIMLNMMASDPTARRAMTHPLFQVPSIVKTLTDTAANALLKSKQQEGGGGAAAANQPPAPVGNGPLSGMFPSSMGKLRPFLERSSLSLKARFNALYEVEGKPAYMKVPEAFAPKVKSMFSLFPGGLGGIENQTIITVYNKFTDEYSLFNEVRRYRPGYMEKLKPEQEAEVNATYSSNAGPDNCDFCSMERTAVDIFGRIESEHCYIASNVAKYESWHSLIVSKYHNPLTFTAPILNDYMRTAQQWFEKVHSIDKDASFPFLSWDAGPRASASQVHQHLQLVLTHDRYLSKAENTRRAASVFERKFPGKSYWEEVATVHAQMGLAVAHGNTVILSHVCPVKEREIILISSDHTSVAFAEALNAVLEALRDDVGVRALSMGMSFKTVGDLQRVNRGAVPIGAAEGDQQQPRHSHRDPAVDEALDLKMLRHYPSIARIIDRGSPIDRRSDSGAMEFFGANNVGADPYFFMPHIRARLAALKK